MPHKSCVFLAAMLAAACTADAAEWTTDFIGYRDSFADARYQTAQPSHERVPYESSPAAVRENETRPAAKRGWRWRGKRAQGYETTAAASRDDRGGAAPTADPHDTDAPSTPGPSVPATPSSDPSVPTGVWPESGGREDGLDKYSDNTPAKPENQERENTNYEQDGETAGVFESCPPAVAQPPTRAEIEDYRRRLEARLLERYNNLPEHAGKVGRVTVVLSKPLQPSLDGSMIRAEFDQLVVDPWGKRIPELEEEYYVVTFGTGGARQVRSDPSIRVGLDLEKTYSERAPISADPFARAPESKAFGPAPVPAAEAPAARMPAWWRPDFPELQ